jgi:hypothetical protein
MSFIQAFLLFLNRPIIVSEILLIYHFSKPFGNILYIIICQLMFLLSSFLLLFLLFFIIIIVVFVSFKSLRWTPCLFFYALRILKLLLMHNLFLFFIIILMFRVLRITVLLLLLLIFWFCLTLTVSYVRLLLNVFI